MKEHPMPVTPTTPSAFEALGWNSRLNDRKNAAYSWTPIDHLRNWNMDRDVDAHKKGLPQLIKKPELCKQ